MACGIQDSDVSALEVLLIGGMDEPFKSWFLETAVKIYKTLLRTCILSEKTLALNEVDVDKYYNPLKF